MIQGSAAVPEEPHPGSVRPTGTPPTGTPPTGTPPTGSPPTGSPPTGGQPAGSPDAALSVGPASWWKRLTHRLTADEAELDAEELRAEASTEGAQPCAFCQRGEVATVAGRVREVIYVPGEAVPTVQAELFDGTGAIRLVWLGRRRIAGIEPGRSLVARGRVARQPDGTLVIYNPWYELKPAT